jgi:hypothetical protein
MVSNSVINSASSAINFSFVIRFMISFEFGALKDFIKFLSSDF